MRGVHWCGILLLVLPGCYTRFLWRQEFRETDLWSAHTTVGVVTPQDGEPPSITLRWPDAEDWYQHRRKDPPIPPSLAMLGLSTSADRVVLVPRRWPSSVAALLSRGDGRKDTNVILTAKIVQGDRALALEIDGSSDQSAIQAELAALPGVVATHWIGPCRMRLVDEARVVVGGVDSGEGVFTRLQVVERTPWKTLEKVALTPITAAMDLVFAPVQLLTLPFWWSEELVL